MVQKNSQMMRKDKTSLTNKGSNGRATRGGRGGFYGDMAAIHSRIGELKPCQLLYKY